MTWVVVAVVWAGAGSGATAASRTPVQSTAAVCTLDDLPGLRGQWLRAWRDAPRPPEAAPDAAVRLAPTRADDFSRVVRAVLGADGDDLARAAAVSPDPAVGAPTLAASACRPEARAKDAVAWTMALGGFSAREMADVLDGHLTLDDVLQARVRIMAGQPRPLVAAFLERQWKTPAPPLAPGPPTAATAAGGVRAPAPLASPVLDAAVDRLANRHGVPAALVRAVIAAESAGNPGAVSPAGAIGLMQLMPGTAAALGVNPREPLDNLRGGIAYLASLLREFDRDTRLALIAYNAGPQHARDVRDGRAVAYRETRAYLDAIGARFPLSPP